MKTNKPTTIERPQTLDELMSIAFRMCPNMILLNYMTNDCTISNLEHVTQEHFDKKYACNSDVFAFIYEQVEYVIPYFGGISAILENSGFTKSCFPVPLNKVVVPATSRNSLVWNSIVRLVGRWNIEDARKKSIDFSKSHNIKPIPNEIFDAEDLIEIPLDGMLVIGTDGNKRMEFPLLSCFGMLTTNAYQKLGTFTSVDNMYVINSNDGRTYILNGFPGIETILSHAGYRNYQSRLSQYLPLNSGEKYFI